MTHTKTIDPEILSILASCTITGDSISLHCGQLDRKTYEKVNVVLELMGGKWSRKLRAHAFPEDPTDLMETVLLTGEITDKKKLFQFYETPVAIAERMVQLANIQPLDSVLEPSAGLGRIVMAVHRAHPDCRIHTVELDPASYAFLENLGLGVNMVDDFLSISFGPLRFDKILMNPPFTRGQDIAHIMKAHSLLAPGGKLVAICANGPRQREKLFPIVSAWVDLPAGTFSESGTGVNTALLVMRS